MLLRGKTIDDLTESDLLDLIGESESNTLDFKRTLPQADTGKREFLVDISSFANAGGGFIIYGMAENDLKATELCGLSGINREKEMQRLQNWANEGLEPRIPGLRIRDIDLASPAEVAIAVRIPRSFAMPHQVKETRRFHSRYSVGKDGMNVAELRAAFNLSENLESRIRTFRRERIQVLAANDAPSDEIPVKLVTKTLLVMHVIPLSFADNAQMVDLSPLQSRNQPQWVRQNYLVHGRFNLEGYVRPNSPDSNTKTEVDGYIQIYRTGAVETVDTLRFLKDDPSPISLRKIEIRCIKNLERTIVVQENLGLAPPVVVMVSITGIKGAEFVYDKNSFTFVEYRSPGPILRDQLLLPDVVLSDYSEDAKTVLRPIFDVLANAAGMEASLSYDYSGKWIDSEH